MKWFRFRVRTLMLAVAILALLLGGIEAVKLNRLAGAYRKRAAYYAGAETQARKAVQFWTANAARCRSRSETAHNFAGRLAFRGTAALSEKDARDCTILAEHNARLRHKWERAAARPWLPVAPDPPPPE